MVEISQYFPLVIPLLEECEFLTILNMLKTKQIVLLIVPLPSLPLDTIGGFKADKAYTTVQLVILPENMEVYA